MRYNDAKPNVYYIPDNFIDEGKIFNGIFKVRNFVEAILFTLLALAFALNMNIRDPSMKIAAVIAVCGPVFALFALGIDGVSVLQYLRLIWRYNSNKRIIIYNQHIQATNMAPLHKLMTEESAADKIREYLNRCQLSRETKTSTYEYVEGENFEFLQDQYLIPIAIETMRKETRRSRKRKMGSSIRLEERGENIVFLDNEE